MWNPYCLSLFVTKTGDPDMAARFSCTRQHTSQGADPQRDNECSTKVHIKQYRSKGSSHRRISSPFSITGRLLATIHRIVVRPPPSFSHSAITTMHNTKWKRAAHHGCDLHRNSKVKGAASADLSTASARILGCTYVLIRREISQYFKGNNCYHN